MGGGGRVVGDRAQQQVRGHSGQCLAAGEATKWGWGRRAHARARLATPVQRTALAQTKNSYAWVLQDLLGIVLMMSMLQSIALPNLKVGRACVCACVRTEGPGARWCSYADTGAEGSGGALPLLMVCQVASVLLLLAFCYDIVFVFGTTIMETVALGSHSGEQVPLLLRFPALFGEVRARSMLARAARAGVGP